MRTLFLFVVFLFTFCNSTIYCQWKGEIKTEKGTLIVKNSDSGLWEGKKRIEFKEVLIIGMENDSYLALPWDMTTDLNDNIYVTDFLDHCIKVYSFQGKFLRTISRKGNGPGEVNEVKKISFISDNKICVSEEWGKGNEIEIFDVDGQYYSSFQTNEIEDGCDMTTSLNGDKIFLARPVRLYRGTKFLEKSRIDLSYVVCSYDLDGNLLEKFCEFEDIGKVSGYKYYTERTYLATLSNGDIAVAFEYPYIINIFSPQGKHKMKITRDNKFFSGIKVETEQMMSIKFLKFIKSAEVKNILSMPGNIFMVVIYNRTNDSYIYDFYNTDGYFLKSFSGDKRFDYIDYKGYIYDITPKSEIPVIKKYKMQLF